MTTQCFFRADAAADGTLSPGIHLGHNNTKLDGNAAGWTQALLHTTRGISTVVIGRSGSTVTGPTSGIEIANGVNGYQWISLPLASDVTISGTITFNLWSLESSMSANAAINCIIERLDSTGAIVSTIAQTTRTTELGTSAAAANFTATPTSTNMLKGDRFRVRVFGDDAGTMASGFTFTFDLGRDTAGSDGDSYITFNETFTFQETEPSGSTLYLTDTAGPAVGSNLEKEMWTSRGAGVVTAVTDTIAGWTTPVQITDVSGETGIALEWYSKQLQAFTLGDIVQLNLRANESASSANAGIRAELAVTDADGSNPTVWAAASLISTATLGAAASGGTTSSGELTTTQAAVVAFLAGDDLAVTDGQRLRLRIFIDDLTDAALGTGQTVSFYYAGTTGGASGDSFIILAQSVSEFVASTAEVPFKARRLTSRIVNYYRRSMARMPGWVIPPIGTAAVAEGDDTATATGTVVNPTVMAHPAPVPKRRVRITHRGSTVQPFGYHQITAAAAVNEDRSLPFVRGAPTFAEDTDGLPGSGGSLNIALPSGGLVGDNYLGFSYSERTSADPGNAFFQAFDNFMLTLGPSAGTNRQVSALQSDPHTGSNPDPAVLQNNQSNPSEYAAGVLALIGGADTSASFDHALQATGTSGTSANIPSITTTIDNTTVFAFVAVWHTDSITTVDPGNGFTQVGGWSGDSIKLFQRQMPTAGTTGTTSVSFSASTQVFIMVVAVTPAVVRDTSTATGRVANPIVLPLPPRQRRVRLHARRGLARPAFPPDLNFVGSAAINESDDTASADGTFIPEITGSAAVTEGDDTATATGSTDTPIPYTIPIPRPQRKVRITLRKSTARRAIVPSARGSAAIIEDYDFSIATVGTSVPPVARNGFPRPQQRVRRAYRRSTVRPVGLIGKIIGTSATTETNDTSTASGSFTPPPITGSAAVTETDDTSTATGAATGAVFFAPVPRKQMVRRHVRRPAVQARFGPMLPVLPRVPMLPRRPVRRFTVRPRQRTLQWRIVHPIVGSATATEQADNPFANGHVPISQELVDRRKKRGGFEPPTRPPERRDFFETKRRVRNLEP